MGSLLWNCYKASCLVKGKSRVHLSAEDIRKLKCHKLWHFEMPEYCASQRRTLRIGLTRGS